MNPQEPVSSSTLYVHADGFLSFWNQGWDWNDDQGAVAQAWEPVIVPFMSDLYTGPVYLEYDVVNGRKTFTVTWEDARPYSHALDDDGVAVSDLYNTFSVTLTDRSDIHPGDFDIDFDYEQIQWDTAYYVDGTPASIGYSNGCGEFWEHSSSGVEGAFAGQPPGPLHFEVRSPWLDLRIAGMSEQQEYDEEWALVPFNHNFDEGNEDAQGSLLGRPSARRSAGGSDRGR